MWFIILLMSVCIIPVIAFKPWKAIGIVRQDGNWEYVYKIIEEKEGYIHFIGTFNREYKFYGSFNFEKY